MADKKTTTGKGKAPRATTAARVNHGRWLADCQKCNGAELVAPGQPFVCRSAGCGAQAIVVWPSPAKRAQIEALLARRPNPTNRNWTPGESVASLQAENRANGIQEEA